MNLLFNDLYVKHNAILKSRFVHMTWKAWQQISKYQPSNLVRVESLRVIHYSDKGSVSFSTIEMYWIIAEGSVTKFIILNGIIAFRIFLVDS